LFLIVLILTVLLFAASVFLFIKNEKYGFKPGIASSVIFIILLCFLIPLGNKPVVDEMTDEEEDQWYEENIAQKPVEEELKTVEEAEKEVVEEVVKEVMEEVEEQEPTITPEKEQEMIDELNKAFEKLKKEEKESKVEESLTLSQKNAIRKAESYLNFTSFSKSGLIRQLEHEGFPTEDATFAVENITVDWMEQAVKKGESYLDFSAFSRQGLIRQLEHEGFSEDQAVHAVDTIGF
jgi:colicin import membrane protein